MSRGAVQARICATLLLALVHMAVISGEGIYSGRVGSERIIPVQTDPNGTPLNPQHRITRAPRPHDDGGLFYHLPLSDGPMILEVWPTHHLVSPSLRVERRGADSGANSGGNPRSRRRRSNPTSCHYHGHVRGQPNSIVALSACGNGLMAMIETEKGSLLLEPSNETDHLQHVVFRGGHGTLQRHRRRHAVDCGTKRATRPRMRDTVRWEDNAKLRVQHRRRGRPRKERSVSTERHVEVLLVADPSMTAFHQDRDLETYLLAIMNMVSAMYHDPSVGNLINIVVVRIVTFEEGQTEFNITVNADKTLSAFCQWAKKNNPPGDDDPQHHDVAVLITRMDMCARGDTPCATLGVAHVGGMCTPDRSCSVNEDTGLVLAHTIAHELGHNFGMYHDTDSSGCSRREGDVLHVMTPAFEPDALHLKWSECSRTAVTRFLEEGSGDCLNDAPTSTDYRYPDGLSGSMYDADHQCRLQFGDSTAEVCSDEEEICQRLWCVVDNVCSTLLRPAAEGTKCGHHKWCHNQQCTLMSDPVQPVDGGWSEWGLWSPCSRTCGAGVAIRQRHCDHPAPSGGGRYCLGERTRYTICNTLPCSVGATSFRALQCSSFNSEPHRGKNYTWLPYFEYSEPCELYCSDDADTIIVPRGKGAKDGTPCNVGKRDMCIGGVCRRVGCDWIVDSDAEEDRCGICRGNGSQCRTIKGTFNKTNGFGYTEVVAIEAGARNILIEEVSASSNYIGIGAFKGKQFYLNGDRGTMVGVKVRSMCVDSWGLKVSDMMIPRLFARGYDPQFWRITLAGEYNVGGALALYERQGERERVRIPGPILDTILVYIIFRGADRNRGLRYEYTIPLGHSEPPKAEWRHADWTPCSATCGGGIQEAEAVCMAAVTVLPDTDCAHLGAPPPKQQRACSGNACPATWWAGPWQLCPVTCGSDVSRQRTVLCVLRGHDHNMALADSDCDSTTKPPEQERCPDVPPCPDEHRELFPMKISQPSAAIKPAEVLDLNGLEPDERAFLTANYVSDESFQTSAPTPRRRTHRRRDKQRRRGRRLPFD